MTVTERLSRCLREGDTLARLGGDEFTVLLEDAAGIETATGIADRIAEALREPILVAGHVLTVSASIGVSLTSTVKALATEEYSPPGRPRACCAMPTSPCTRPKTAARRAGSSSTAA